MSHHSARWITVAALLLAAIVGVRAHAQGQAFPPPISTEALERSLGRYVKPPADSKPAIEAAHDRYLDEYRRLQDAELEGFAKEQPPMFTGGDMGAWMRRYSALRGRVIALDSTLIEAIRQAVPESQRQGVDRIRWIREAEVLRSGLLGDMSGPLGATNRARVSDIVYSLPLSEADVAAADPVLRDFEQRMLSSVRKSADETERLITDLTDRMRKEGLWGDALVQAQQDPEKAVELSRRMSAIFSDTFGNIIRISQAQGELGRKGYVQVRERLSWDGQTALVPAWLGATSPQLSHQYPKAFIDLTRRAVHAVGAETPQGQAIESIGRETMQRVIASLDAAEQLEDRLMADLMSSQFTMMEEGGMESRQAMMEEHQRLRSQDQEARARIVQSGFEAIKAQLPPDAAERLQLPQGADTQIDWTGSFPGAAVDAATAPAEPDELEMAEAVVAAESPGSEVVIDALAHQLSPYSVAQLQRFMTRIGVQEDQRATLEMLHADYLARWTEEVGAKRSALDEARARMYTHEEGQMPVLDSSKAEAAAAILRELVAATERVDDEYFGVMGAALGAPHATAVRVERLGRVTATLGRVQHRDWSYRPNAEQAIDVVAVLRAAALPAADQAMVEELLAAHADAIAEASRLAFQRSVEAQLGVEKLQSQIWKPDLTAEERTRAAVDWQRRLNEISAPAKAASDARRAACTAVFDAAQERLPEASKSALQRAWSQASYPSIFNDPSAHFETIKRVQQLHDLTPDQAQRVTAALEEYRMAYDLACDALLAASLMPMPEMKDGMNQEYWMAVQERERAIGRMRFERDETSARAGSRLRQILTPEQLAQFRTLEDPAKTRQQSAPRW